MFRAPPRSIFLAPLYGPGTFAAIGIGLVILSLLGFFRWPNGLLYDHLTRWSPFAPPPARVLVVEVDPPLAAMPVADWASLQRKLDELGARRVAFTFWPAEGGEVVPAWAQHPDVVLGWVPERRGGSEARLPGMAGEAQVALAALPPLQYGVARVLRTSAEIGDHDLPAMAVLAAGADPDGLPREVLVNFVGGADRLPRIGLERALGGGLVRSLVEGRTVLVGPPGERLFTPAGELDLLAFQGLATDTLVQERAITSLALWAAPLILAVALISLLAYQNLEIHLASVATVALLAFYLLAAWLLLGGARLWLPLTEILLAQFLFFFQVFIRKAELESSALRETLVRTSVRLQERLFPAGVLVSEDHWAQVITMVDQALDLNRLIFLEKVPGDHRLREVKSLRCSLDDIAERRRDYERTPYSSAIDRNGPYRLEKKEYLVSASSDELQYLVPLSFAGEVLGFWAFGVDVGKKEARPDFEDSVGLFAEQIAELLHQRQQLAARRGEERLPWLRYLRLEGGSGAGQALKQSVTLLEKRLLVLENVFSGLDSAMILYDLFGRVLLANRVMVELLQEAGLAPYGMTLLDLATAVTGRGSDEIRKALETVVLEEGEVALRAQLPNFGERAFLLRVKPLAVQRELDLLEDAESYPFRLQGLLCELIDLDRVCVGFAGSSRHDDELLPPPSLEAAIRLALGQVRAEAARRDIDLGLELAAEAAPLPAPPALAEVVETLLDVLLQDAAEGTRLMISLDREPQTLCLRLGNEGFGIPDERLKEFLYGAETAATQEVRRLRRAVRSVRAWGGQLEAVSEVGAGTRFQIRIPQV